ncbi:MAG: UvrD-helicase domain-containing protein [Bacteroidales bacterium]|nr:UvrD-helicase domain-containing protein [Bacteroidales bacterium]
MDDIFSGLNDRQSEAVRNVDGPCLVIAGAGSGKTRVLTYRIAYLLSLGVPAYNILALTFTNKAAAEMKERIARLVGDDVARNLKMGTFHSIFAKILRMESAALPGYDSNFTILDTDDVKKQITQIITSLNLDKDTYKASKIASIISKAKNDMILSENYEGSSMWQLDRMNGMPAVASVYKEYSQTCRKTNSMDFDDLLLLTKLLFSMNPAVLEKYQRLFRYILVDEYQDTNSCQYQIIRMLAHPDNNLCVVGDDAQSIYSFRGAKIENILNFSKDYPSYKLFKLEQNYRSTQMIVNAANSLIMKNKRQIPKKTFSEQECGEKIKIVETPTDAEEGIRVATMISSLIDNGEQYSDCAILYRTNAQSRILEEAMHKKRIPCKIVKGMSFFQRKEIKDLVSYVRVIINPQDELALMRIINYPARSIGSTTVEKLTTLAKNYNLGLWDVMCQVERTGSLFPTATKTKILGFVALMQEFMASRQEADAYSLLNRIVEKIGIREALQKEYTHEEACEREENILELLNGAKEFVEDELDPESIYLHNYMEKIALLTDIDEEDTENPNKVLLMTVHAAKGLEFKHCFIVGMEENLFPSLQVDSASEREMEEERRLFYVALTRAKQTVTISYALTRRKWGDLIASAPSRFLSELDEEYVDGYKKMSRFDADAQSFGDYSARQGGFSSYGTQRRGQTSFGAHNSFRSGGSFGQYGASKPQQFSSPTRNTGFSSAPEKPFAHYGENTQKQQQPQTIIPSNPNDIAVGQRVLHAKFGIGTVKEKMGEDANMAVIIAFNNWGEKKLLLKFAKLQIVEN